MKKLFFPSVCCALLVLAGCASVKVIKVNEGQPQPEGIPFYLPRPYVQVYEPFVVSSKVFLSVGQLTPDGQYLLIDNVKGDLGGMLAADLSKESSVRFPASAVSLVSPPVLTAGPQMGDAGAQAPAAAASTPATGTSAPKPAASAPEAPSSTPVGQYNMSVTQSATPFPTTLGRRFFDVVWMPDFDEKYVIQGQQGLGNATVGVTMVQGWGLYGLDARIDNSAIVRPLLDFYSTGLGALSKLAQSKILPASALMGAPQSGDSEGGKPLETAKGLVPGTRVSVKVTKVLVAAPGLYPVLKPKEVGSEAAKDQDTDKARVLIPQRPYTNVAFNVYEVVVVEAAKPTGDTPMNLQRYFDVDGQGKTASVPAAAAPGSNPAFDTAKFTVTVNDLLKTERGTDGGFWVISDVSAGKKLKATATLTGGAQKPTKYATKASLQQLLSVQSKQFATQDIEISGI